MSPFDIIMLTVCLYFVIGYLVLFSCGDRGMSPGFFRGELPLDIIRLVLLMLLVWPVALIKEV